MNTAKTVQLSFASELRISHKWVVGLVAVAGWFLILTVDPRLGAEVQFRLVLIGVLVEAGALFAWRCDGQWQWLGSWLAVFLFVVVVVLVSFAWEWPAFLAMLAVPAALAGPLIDLRAVWKTTAAETAMLAAGVSLGWIDPVVAGTIALLVWAISGVMSAVYRPLQHVMQWTWEYAQQAQKEVEEARDHKARLEQALEDLVRANAQLTRLNLVAQGLRQAAEDSRIVKEQFVANVSHELRTPLNMITGFSEMILQSPKTYGGRIPAALLADLAVIHRNADHLANLINDVLDLSQMEAEQMVLSKEFAALGEIVAEAATSVRPLYELKGLYLRTIVPEDLPPLYCDRTRIQEVLLNLLSNAGRFTEQGGVMLQAMSDGTYITVSIADTGPGIAPDNIPMLFQPFRQLDASLQRRHSGTGLGLSISKRFVELHGGKIWAESKLGQGTTFLFRLPLRSHADALATAAATRWLNSDWEHIQRTRPSAAPKIVVRPRLVVLEESGDSLQRLLARHVEGVEIAPVTSLEEAHTELAQSLAKALVVNAVSVDQELARIEAAGILPLGVPALICAIPGLRQVSEALGVFGLLVKPISREMLLDALQRLQLKRGIILVVDDEPDALQLFGRILASFGRAYRVLLARDGQEAMAVVSECRPDLILLDLIMPNKDGFQVLADLRQDPVTQGIPVMIISARDPVGGPIVSSSLAITRQGGISATELLAHVQSLVKI